MEIKLSIAMADPAGNRTAFIMTETDPSLYGRIGAAILKDPNLRAEQSGFVVPPKMGGDARLEMSGGEFCGNATRSLGILIGRQKGLKAGDHLKIEVSGADHPLDVRLDEDGAWAEMPVPNPVSQVHIHGKEPDILTFPEVKMDGITHAILPDMEPDQELADRVIAYYRSETKVEAAGACFQFEGQLRPYVWVRETGAKLWESSCGSGTLAAAVFLARGVQKGTFRTDLRQPGGVLSAEVEKDSFRILTARIGGPVTLEPEVVKTLEIE